MLLDNANRFLSAVLRILVATCALQHEAASADTIRIGAVLSVSGSASFVGEPELKTLEMYVNQINEGGGLIGRRLELVVYDDGGDATKARTFATRLVEHDNINVLIGGSTTGATMAMVPVLEAAKIPFISLAGSVNIIEPVKRYVFKTPHTDRMGCQKIFADLQKRGLTKIALIKGNDGFGLSMREQCVKVVDSFGVKIVIEQSYGAQDSDMTPQLAKIKGMPEVQAIVNTGGSGQGPIVLTRNYGVLGMKTPLYQSAAVASKSFIELAGSAAEGVRLPAAALLIGDKLPIDDPQRPVVLAYTQAFEKATGQPVSAFGGGAYDALMIFAAAVRTANSAEPEAVRSAIEQTKGFVGTAGVVNMSPTDHMGLGVDAFRMVVVRNGDWALSD